MADQRACSPASPPPAAASSSSRVVTAPCRFFRCFWIKACTLLRVVFFSGTSSENRFARCSNSVFSSSVPPARALLPLFNPTCSPRGVHLPVAKRVRKIIACFVNRTVKTQGKHVHYVSCGSYLQSKCVISSRKVARLILAVTYCAGRLQRRLERCTGRQYR